MVNGLALFQLKNFLAQMQQDPSATDVQRKLRQMFQPALEQLELKSDGTALSLTVPIPEGFDGLAKLVAPGTSSSPGRCRAGSHSHAQCTLSLSDFTIITILSNDFPRPADRRKRRRISRTA